MRLFLNKILLTHIVLAYLKNKTECVFLTIKLRLNHCERAKLLQIATVELA